jgi:hypothetical protein
MCRYAGNENLAAKSAVVTLALLGDKHIALIHPDEEPRPCSKKS